MRSIVFLLVTTALLGACADLISEPDDSRTRGLVLSVDASPREIAPGDTVRIVARLRNTNTRPVTLNFTGGCQILYFVEDAAGRPVEPKEGSWGCTAALTSLRLGAGQTEERTFFWLGQRVVGYDQTTWRPIMEPLPAGEYRVRATLVDSEFDGKRISLRTPAVPLTLR